MFYGSIPALITPFRDGIVDEQGFQSFVEWQIAQGSHGLVPCGTTGESVTLSAKEHVRVVEMCVEAAARRVPVIAGAGSNSTAHAIELARQARHVGADAVLVVAPYYNRPSQEGLYAHYKAINDAVEIPIVVYNVPSRTVVDISVETLGRIAKLANVVGLKDAGGDVGRVSRQRLACGPDFIQLSGDDPNAIGYNAMGGKGCISVTANVAPKLCAELQNATRQGDFEAAQRIDDKVAALHKALFVEPSPAPAKYGASLLGKCTDDVRLPIVPCSESAKAVVRAAMSSSGPDLMAKKADPNRKLVAENRRARFDYSIEDVIEAGIQLVGTEVKSLRGGRANIAESYASTERGELWLINATIPVYPPAGQFNHEPRRPRKLLVRARELHKLAVAVEREGRTLAPLKLYFNDRGIAKIEIALAKGKKAHDKREATKDREWKRQQSRLMRDKG